MPSEYYYLDVAVKTMEVIGFGVSETASHDGHTDDPQVHRVFLTKGQFNKLEKELRGER
ncbi:MAG: hypothetical protein RL068_121 [Actinomycetota bacterium]|jgi:hypothetical protein